MISCWQNNIAILKKLKIELAKKYEVKDLRKIKTIINQNIIQDLSKRTLKVDHLSFMKDLFKKKNLIDYNTLNIFIKTELCLLRY